MYIFKSLLIILILCNFFFVIGTINKPQTVTICENNSQKIMCPRGASIIIEDAFYGRTDKTTCPHQQMHDVQCRAGNAFQIVNNR